MNEGRENIPEIPHSLHYFLSHQLKESEEVLPSTIVDAVMEAPLTDDWREKRAARKVFSLIEKGKYRVSQLFT